MDRHSDTRQSERFGLILGQSQSECGYLELILILRLVVHISPTQTLQPNCLGEGSVRREVVKEITEITEWLEAGTTEQALKKTKFSLLQTLVVQTGLVEVTQESTQFNYEPVKIVRCQNRISQHWMTFLHIFIHQDIWSWKV